MNWIKRLLGKNKDKKCAKSVVKDTSVDVSDKCICELNAEGNVISGWCVKHHTDWM